MGGSRVLTDADDSDLLGNDDTPPPYTPPPYSEEEPVITEEITSPMLVYKPPLKRLSCPVVIPQRRPGSKTRGFMRAYAPVLADYGINEESFLNFLKAFHKASLVAEALFLPLAIQLAIPGRPPDVS